MRSMRSLSMMAIVSIIAPPTVRIFIPASPNWLGGPAPASGASAWAAAVVMPPGSHSSSRSLSHSRTPPVTPAVFDTMTPPGGSGKAILRALPPPM